MRTSVAVVGGGSTGSSILFHAAKRGLTDAILIDKGSGVASGQTSRSSALVRTHYTVPVVARMALLSYLTFSNFSKEMPGFSSGYVETGLLIGVTPELENAVRKNLDFLHTLGIVSEFIDRDEVRSLEPHLDTSAFSSVVHEPHMGYAEPSATTSSYASAAERLGARVLTGTTLEGVEKVSEGYLLRTSAGTITAAKVVLATGVWSGPVFRRLGIDLPVKVVRHPVAIFERPPEFRGRRPVVFDFLRSGYYKPEGKSLLFVGSMEAEVDASGVVADPDRYDKGISFEETEKYTTWTTGAYPIMSSGGTFSSGYSGAYDNTPDQQPIIDELSGYGYRDMFCLVGLSGHGFKLCPEFGRIMGSLVADGKFDDYDISVFRLNRFREGRPLTSWYPVSTVG